MSLIHPAMLYGLGLVAIPVILHFLLRSKPKKLLFPALRLIKQRQRRNVKRMRLRHIWLLLLRMLVIGLIVFALMRPSLPAADYGLEWSEILTVVAVAAILVGAYLGMMRRWRRRRVPHHDFVYRRTLLRAGLGTAGLLLLLLLVGWPYQRRIRADLAAPPPNVAEALPVAAVFLFDTSLSMDYRQENHTRLELARQIAGEQLSHLPARSRVAVADTASSNPLLFQADVSAAKSRIEDIEVHALNRPLNERLTAACRLQDEDRSNTLSEQSAVPAKSRQDRFLREIYVFTDLARSGWNRAGAKQLRSEIARLEWIGIYLVDVGAEKPRNVALGRPTLSRQSLPLGDRLVIEADVHSIGEKEVSRTVELVISDGNSRPVKKGQQTVKLDESTDGQVAFVVDGLKGPLAHGELRFSSADPFVPDNTQYFTVQVRPPPKVLLVSPTQVAAEYLQQALAPDELARLGRARYNCTLIPAEKLSSSNLGDYDAVCLINVPAPSESDWSRLERFVEAGDGLAVFLGSSKFIDAERGIDPVSYNSKAAQEILPAVLKGSLRFAPPEFLDITKTTHPILEKLENLGGAAMLGTAEVRRFWRTEPVAGASAIISYTDYRKTPALIERTVGDGRVVMLTTAVDREGWSDLPLAEWAFVAFADRLLHYTLKQTERRFNYEAGEEIFVELSAEPTTTHYLLRKPSLQQLPKEVADGQRTLIVRDADQVGHYEVVSRNPDDDFLAGFSVVAPPGESDFKRLVTPELDELLGEKRYSVTRDLETLTRNVTLGRLGVEAYPLIVLFLAGVFAMEHVVANRFYLADQDPNQEYQ